MRYSNVNIIKKERKIIEKLAKSVLILYFSLVAICMASLVIINSTWIYKVVIKKYNLTSITGISEKALMSEYRGLINYLQNPFVDKLKFDNFVMSTYGEVHFYEVKRIFIALIIIVTIFMVGLIGWFIFNKYQKGLINIRGLLRGFNNSANLLIIFLIGIVILYFIDFSWAFIMFHKIFFKNDYWIFDPVIDPIIMALPEELFMICGGGILILLLIMIIAVKYFYYRNRNNIKSYSENNNIEI